MPEAKSERISLDDLLKKQGESESNLLATIESTSELNKVKLTPWMPNAGCSCNLAVILEKNHIKSVRPTEDRHNCCGKQLIVVDVEFADTAKAYLDVITQLKKNVAAKDHGHNEHPMYAPPPPFYGNQTQHNPMIVCPWGTEPCVGRCGEGCFDSARGQTCRNGKICGWGLSQCGCQCYDPARGETCGLNGQVMRSGHYSTRY